MTATTTATTNAPPAVTDAEAAAFLEVAAAIGRRLAMTAVWNGERCNWLGWAYHADGERITPVYRAMGPALGDGTAGIGLFLAELWRATGDPLVRQAARGALAHAARHLDDGGGAVADGLYTGRSAAAIAFTLAARALGDEQWDEAARLALSGLSNTVTKPQPPDLYGGRAGAALALLDAAAAANDTALRTAAFAHGRQLVESARRGPHGASWATAPDQPHPDLVGGPHGAGGIAVALLELHAAGGDEAFRDTALSALAYETAHFDPHWRLWPDLRLDAGPANLLAANPARYPVAWIHGAVGVGLVRLRLRTLLPERAETDAEIRDAVNAALATLVPPALPAISFAQASGAAGNAAFVLQAAAALGQPEWRDYALYAARHGVQAHAAPRVPWPCGGPPNGETPNLLFGLAGIGRFYLELADPERVRSLLTFTPRPQPADLPVPVAPPPAPEPPEPEPPPSPPVETEKAAETPKGHGATPRNPTARPRKPRGTRTRKTTPGTSDKDDTTK